MTSDDVTLGVYATKADEYAEKFGDAFVDPALTTFIGGLAQGARVLDLGCGPGMASAQMARAGLQVDATDAVAEMVALAGQHDGVTAWQASFDDIEGVDLYAGIWANFSLLHAPRTDMPHHLAALRRALKPGGLFHIGMKTGTGEHRDALGRLYTYYTTDEMHGLLVQAGLTPFSSQTGRDKGLAGTDDEWFTMAAHG